MFEVELTNFKCHADQEYKFDQDSQTLLSGPSGSGKSSVVDAILFCLTGGMRCAKLASFGSSSCGITVRYKDMEICRTRAPNRLVLTQDGETYEDADAQCRINEYFGKDMEVTSCILQNQKKSFLYKTPKEKLEFLESTYFDSIPIAENRDKIQEGIRVETTRLRVAESQLRERQEQLALLTEPTVLDFPINSKSGKPLVKPETREKAVAQKRDRSDEFSQKIEKYTSDIRSLKEELHENELLSVFNTTKAESLFRAKQLLNDAQQSLVSCDECDSQAVETLEKQIQKCRERQQKLTLIDTIDERKAYLEKEVELYRKELESKEEVLVSEIWTDEERDENNDYLGQLKTAISDMLVGESLQKQIDKSDIDEDCIENTKTKISDVQARILKYQNAIDSKDVKECPECSVQLNLRGNKLCLFKAVEVAEEWRDNDIDELKTLLLSEQQIFRKCERLLSEQEVKNEEKNQKVMELDKIMEQYDLTISDAREDEFDIRRSIDEQANKKAQLETLRKQMKGELRPPSCKHLPEEIKKLTKQMEKLSLYDGEDFGDEMDLQRRLGSLNETSKMRDMFQSDIISNSELVSHTQEEIDYANQKYLERFSELRDNEILTKNISKISLKLDEVKSKYDDIQDTFAEIEEWRIAEDRCVEYARRQTLVLEKEIEVGEIKIGIQDLEGLKAHLNMAEQSVFSDLLGRINSHSKFYVDKFFPDTHISATLQSFREQDPKDRKVKESRPQIKLEIDYQGSILDSIDHLSGGEGARIMLAITLALSEIYNNPVLLLDECTANLNEELVSIVLNTIKEHMPNKIVIVVAHQTVNGIFDKVIEF